MAASKNHVSLIGRFGNDVELRQTNSGTAVANVSLATNEYRGKGEDRQEITEWHRIVLWGKDAEIAAQYAGKGSLIGIEGRLSTRKWEKDGVEHYTTEVICNDLYLLGGNGGSKHTGGDKGNSLPDDALPF